MANTLYQCIFTRVGGQGASAGWQTIALQEQIPSEVLNNFSSLQSLNVASSAMLDENGEPMVLNEVISRGQYLYVTRVQYGLDDELGRKNNLLAHGIILYMPDANAYMDPNEFLSISSASFLRSLDLERKAPSPVVYDSRLELETALALAGLDKEKWEGLVYSVLSALEQNKPLFLHSTEEESRAALLYCIYASLPLGVRKNVACSTMQINPGSAKSIVLSDKHGSSDLFFDLRTGENNTVSERLSRKYKRWGYPGYVIENHNTVDCAGYFCQLHEKVVELGDETGAKPRFLRIAHNILCGNPLPSDPDELNSRIYEALSAGMGESPCMNEYLCKLVQSANLNDVVLIDESFDGLQERASNASDFALSQECRVYVANALKRMTAEEGVRKLIEMEPAERDGYLTTLNDDSQGRELVDSFFCSSIGTVSSWGQLKRLCQDATAYGRLPRISDEIDSKAANLYIRDLSGEEDAQSVLQRYVGFMAPRTDPYAMGELERAAKEIYWEEKEFSTFEYKQKEEYEAFSVEGNRKSKLYQIILVLFDDCSRGIYSSIPTTVEQLLQYELSEEDKEELLRRLFEVIKESDEVKKTLIEIYCYLLIMAGWTDLDSLQDRFISYVQDQRWGDLIQEYRELTDGLRENQESQKIMTYFNYYFQHYMRERGLLDALPVDIWLTMGMTMFDNPFMIFDDTGIWENDYLLEIISEEIVEDSELLDDGFYQQKAKDYIKDDGWWKLVVKDWLRVQKKLQKKTSKHKKSKSMRLFRRGD